MAAIWHDSGSPSWLGIPPSFSFHDLPEIHQLAPIEYQQAMKEIHEMERRMGVAYYWHNADLAYSWFKRKQPWYL